MHVILKPVWSCSISLSRFTCFLLDEFWVEMITWIVMWSFLYLMCIIKIQCRFSLLVPHCYCFFCAFVANCCLIFVLAPHTMPSIHICLTCQSGFKILSGSCCANTQKQLCKCLSGCSNLSWLSLQVVPDLLLSRTLIY